MASTLSRRRFLGRTVAGGAAACTAPWFIPAAALGRDGRAAPSERITVGLIGCGGMGRGNLAGFVSRPEVQAIAVCDPDRSRRDAARRDVPGGCEAYADFRDLLARDDLDAVIVASPDHWHALHVIAAVQAGKDVYGEKPLSLTVREGRAMADAVARTGRVFQTGSQQRSDARFRRACELVRNGRLGAIRRVTCGLPAGETTGNHPPLPVPEGFDYDLWLGPAPWAPYCAERTHYVFRHLLDYSGGKLTDWGAHHIDIAQWALDRAGSGPTFVEARGEFPEDGLWNAAVQYDVRCRYADGIELLITSRAPNGVRFEGDRGALFVSRGELSADPVALLGERIGPGEARVRVSDDHHGDFLASIRTRRPPIAPIEEAHRTITVAHLGNIAMQLGRAIRWDPSNERILDDSTADSMLGRVMRAPWGLS